MTASPADPSFSRADLGELSFDLDAASLRQRGRARLERAQRGLDRLLSAPGPPAVESFLEPLNRLLTEVRDASSHGTLLFSVHPEPECRTAARELSEEADRFMHAFRLNERAYAALRALDLRAVDPAGRFAVEKLVREMRRAGVEKDAAHRARLLELNRLIDQSCNLFNENIATHERSIEVDSLADLQGLPTDFLKAHPPDANGKIRVTTKYPDFGPVMAYAENADVRRRLLYEFTNRAFPENEPVLAEIVSRRDEFARLLGYPSYAAFAVEDKMLQTPEAVRALLDRLAERLTGLARADLARLLDRKRRDAPDASKLEPWELSFFGPGFYDQKIRTEEFGIDMRQLRAYLPYGRIRDGMFELCRELFGITFSPSTAQVWHPTVQAFDVRRDGEPLGRVFFDFTPRDGKYSHAACFSVRDGLQGVQLPQAALVCNFLLPDVPTESARLDHHDVVTFFHEFGHLLHHLLAGRPRWLYNSQSNLEWDFIEAPSQLFEEWANDPETLARFAVDPDTGERVPRDLLDRLKAASRLCRPLGWLRQVGLSAISLDLYSGGALPTDLSEATRQAYARYAPEPIPQEYHFEAAFGHLTGYSAFYYTYLWSAVIARDLLSPFHEKGALTDREVAARYAAEILAPGSSRPALELVRTYLGRDFSYEAFEKWVAEPARLPR